MRLAALLLAALLQLPTPPGHKGEGTIIYDPPEAFGLPATTIPAAAPASPVVATPRLTG
jgi:hypothetical protein